MPYIRTGRYVARTQQLSISLPKEQVEALRALAEHRGERSFSATISAMVAIGLNAVESAHDVLGI
jgi:hypothetical protein